LQLISLTAGRQFGNATATAAAKIAAVIIGSSERLEGQRASLHPHPAGSPGNRHPQPQQSYSITPTLQTYCFTTNSLGFV